MREKPERPRPRPPALLECLGRIDAILKQKDLRIIDLFSASGFDTSGDGLLNAEEMRGALAKAGLKLNRIEARALIEYLR